MIPKGLTKESFSHCFAEQRAHTNEYNWTYQPELYERVRQGYERVMQRQAGSVLPYSGSILPYGGGAASFLTGSVSQSF